MNRPLATLAALALIAASPLLAGANKLSVSNYDVTPAEGAREDPVLVSAVLHNGGGKALSVRVNLSLRPVVSSGDGAMCCAFDDPTPPCQPELFQCAVLLEPYPGNGPGCLSFSDIVVPAHGSASLNELLLPGVSSCGDLLLDPWPGQEIALWVYTVSRKGRIQESVMAAHPFALLP